MSNSRQIFGAVAAIALVLTSCGSEGTSDPVTAPSTVESPAAEDSSPTEVSPTPSPTTDPSTKGSGDSTEKVGAKVIDTDFRPVELTISPGTTVRWKQVGDQPHSVSAVDGSFDSSPDCGPIDSDMCLGEGDNFSAKFDEAGTFDYYCRVHGLPDGTGMFGTVIVK